MNVTSASSDRGTRRRSHWFRDLPLLRSRARTPRRSPAAVTERERGRTSTAEATPDCVTRETREATGTERLRRSIDLQGFDGEWLGRHSRWTRGACSAGMKPVPDRHSRARRSRSGSTRNIHSLRSTSSQCVTRAVRTSVGPRSRGRCTALPRRRSPLVQAATAAGGAGWAESPCLTLRVVSSARISVRSFSIPSSASAATSAGSALGAVMWAAMSVSM